MRAIWLVMCLSVFSALGEPARAAQVDLNEFYADPTVDVSADGTMALLNEDPQFILVVLNLNPSFGNLDLIEPGPGRVLVFDYEVDIPDSMNDDEFVAFLFNASTGFSLGAPFEFVTNSSGAGQVSFDLSSLMGTTLGLQFHLEALPGDVGLDTTVKVSDVRLEDMDGPGLSDIPEPGTAFSLLGGVVLLGWRRRRQTKG